MLALAPASTLVCSVYPLLVRMAVMRYLRQCLSYGAIECMSSAPLTSEYK